MISFWEYELQQVLPDRPDLIKAWDAAMPDDELLAFLFAAAVNKLQG